MKKQNRAKSLKSNFYLILTTIFASLFFLVGYITISYRFFLDTPRKLENLIYILISSFFALLAILIIFIVNFKVCKKLKKYAYVDILTGLANMHSFIRIADTFIEKHKHDSFFVAWIDILGFNLINQRHGMDIGDKILISIGEFLKRNSLLYVAARVEGDNFAILVKKGSKEQAREKIVNLLQLIKQKIKKEMDINIEFITGICIYGDDIKNGADILEKAHIAQNIARDNHLPIVLFNKTIKDKLLEEDKLAEDIIAGLGKGEFCVHYQPKYNILNGEMVGVEALARWSHPEEGFIPPVRFLNVAAKKGVLTLIDDFVFERVCANIQKWHSDCIYVPVSVNCEKEMFINQTIFEKRFAVMEKYGIGKGDIQFEITERTAIEDYKRTASLLKELQARGYTVAVDDFGTGYSSLSMLRSLPIDAVKLDKSFIREVMLDEMDRKIISSFVEIFNILGLETIAEGVETLEELAFLKECGVCCAQGFLLDFPLTEEDLYQRFKANKLRLSDKDVLDIITAQDTPSKERYDATSPSFYYRNILIKGKIDFLEVDLTANLIIYNGLTKQGRLLFSDGIGNLASGKSYSIAAAYFVKTFIAEKDRRKVALFLSKKSLQSSISSGNYRGSIRFNLLNEGKILNLGELSVVLIEDKNKSYAIIKYKDIKE